MADTPDTPEIEIIVDPTEPEQPEHPEDTTQMRAGLQASADKVGALEGEIATLATQFAAFRDMVTRTFEAQGAWRVTR